MSIRISEGTSPSEISQWLVGQSAEFNLTKSSSFEPGAQGMALSALRSFSAPKANLRIVCDFEEPATIEDLNDTIFASAFGFSLARLSTNIAFSRGKTEASDNFKNLLADSYRNGKGCMGSARQVSMISRDPQYVVPPILECSRDEMADGFPLPSVLAKALHHVSSTMGFSGLLESQTEVPLVEFVYELLRNTFEHARPTSSSSFNRSTRTVILEKVSANFGDSAGETKSPMLAEYLRRVRENPKWKIGVGIACITVADQGPGIQNTLPRKSQEEDLGALARAFLENESRKPQGAIQRGKGLARVLWAAHRLESMLYVSSGGVFATVDFSTGAQRYPQLTFDNAARWPSEMQLGTSISIFLPNYADNPDQHALFPSLRT